MNNQIQQRRENKRMTREEILALPVGRELDMIVAEKLMGFKIDRHRPGLVAKGGQSTYPKKYSTEISAAMEVAEKMKRDGWSVSITTWGNDKNERPEWQDKWKVVFGFEGGPFFYSSHNLAEAVSKAALLAALDLEDSGTTESA